MTKGRYFLDKYAASSESTVDLSVVMPCFNEADRLESVLREWNQILSEEVTSFELLVVNDGSTDGSGRLLDRLRKELPHLRVAHQLNSGRERAVRRGLEAARGRYLLEVDCNGCFEPSDFLRMWEVKEDHVLVMGTRTHRLDGPLRKGLDRLLSRSIRMGFGIQLTDPRIPIRLLRKDVAFPILTQIPLETESVGLYLTLSIAQNHPEGVIEIAVPYRRRKKRKMSTSRRSLVAIYRRLFSDLIQLKAAGLESVPA